MALPVNALDDAIVRLPVPVMPLPLLVILPFTVAVIPVVCKAAPLFIVKFWQVKEAGAVLVTSVTKASVIDVGTPVLHMLPFQVVENKLNSKLSKAM